jgi:pimeloyl-ACP methyl ester carboxylesterase
MRILPAIALASTVILFAGCGGGGGSASGSFNPPASSTARGTAVTLPPAEVVRFSASDLSTLLDATTTGKQLKQLAGTPVCGIDLRYLNYRTIGGQGEATTATAAVMVPSGTAASCNGPMPMVLYAHGTTVDRAYNIADWINPNQSAAAEGSLVAAFYAAQGFIVVAPNYAGYDASPLPYHPYLNGNQQGKDMADALTAARTALPTLNVTASSALFVAGYSQGGYVALAALRELQSVRTHVTAVAPMSAPSAISLLIDYSFSGWPALGATVFTPLITASWQKQFGNIYTNTTDIYSSQYATGIATLLPTLSPNTLFTSGLLPQLALYPANAVPGPVSPSLSIFYGSGNLITQAYLTKIANDIVGTPCPGNALPATGASLTTGAPLACNPQTGLRQAAVANDLRSFLPTAPMLMCGGDQDPTVNFLSTQSTAGYFISQGMAPNTLTVLNLEQSTASDAFTADRAAFAQFKAATAANAGTDPNVQAQAVAQAYHGTLVPPFCMAAAAGFFKGILNAGG